MVRENPKENDKLIRINQELNNSYDLTYITKPENIDAFEKLTNREFNVNYDTSIQGVDLNAMSPMLRPRRKDIETLD